MDINQLESLFISDITAAIGECQKMIYTISNFNSYEEFISYHKENARFYYCPKRYGSFFSENLTIFCLDCSQKYNTDHYICLSCFLNGNHEGHNYYLVKSASAGICKCGCEEYIKPSGFCSKHQRCEDDDDDNLDNYLDPNLRSLSFWRFFL